MGSQAANSDTTSAYQRFVLSRYLISVSATTVASQVGRCVEEFDTTRFQDALRATVRYVSSPLLGVVVIPINSRDSSEQIDLDQSCAGRRRGTYELD